MEPLVDVVIEDDRWLAIGLDALAQSAVGAVMAERGLPATGFTLCLMACDDARIATLNADFRGKPVATNVLSWPAADRAAAQDGAQPDLPAPGPADDPTHLGDVAISFDTCTAEALAASKPMPDHVAHLIVHGVLHLFGFDHTRNADGDLMEATEAAILARLGLANPYNA